MKCELDIRARHVWAAIIFAVAVCMMAGAGVTWFINMYIAPRYEDVKRLAIEEYEGETKAMKNWNKKVMMKGKKKKTR